MGFGVWGVTKHTRHHRNDRIDRIAGIDQSSDSLIKKQDLIIDPALS